VYILAIVCLSVLSYQHLLSCFKTFNTTLTLDKHDFCIVFINCHFPFSDALIEELGKLPFVSSVYRTSGIYDIIVRVNSLTEEALSENMIGIAAA
jgi:DNA-binding Lrp family transcriptional regulator